MRALTQALIGVRPTLRRLLPRQLHHVTGQAARWFIRSVEATGAGAGDIGTFAPAAAPLFKPEAFAAGPILHANTALAWGGAERQLVNILKRLPQRLSCPVGLLCLRLGESPEFDFFLPELAGAAPPPRNAMDVAAALTQLEHLGGASVPSDIAEALAWAPKDFVADVLRFAGEFAVQRPRVVHGWQDGVGLAAGFAALAVGVPRIVVAGRNVRPANFSYYRPYMHAAYRLLAAEPRVILCNNSEAGARDYAAWLGIDPARIRVVRNGIDDDRVRRIQGAEIKAFRERAGRAGGRTADRLDLPALSGEAAPPVGACGAIDRPALARGAFCRVRLGLDGGALRSRGQPTRARRPPQADAAHAAALAHALRVRCVRADIAVRGHAQRRARGRACRRALSWRWTRAPSPRRCSKGAPATWCAMTPP